MHLSLFRRHNRSARMKLSRTLRPLDYRWQAASSPPRARRPPHPGVCHFHGNDLSINAVGSLPCWCLFSNQKLPNTSLLHFFAHPFIRFKSVDQLLLRPSLNPLHILLTSRRRPASRLALLRFQPPERRFLGRRFLGLTGISNQPAQ